MSVFTRAFFKASKPFIQSQILQKHLPHTVHSTSLLGFTLGKVKLLCLSLLTTDIKLILSWSRCLESSEHFELKLRYG